MKSCWRRRARFCFCLHLCKSTVTLLTLMYTQSNSICVTGSRNCAKGQIFSVLVISMKQKDNREGENQNPFWVALYCFMAGFLPSQHQIFQEHFKQSPFLSRVNLDTVKNCSCNVLARLLNDLCPKGRLMEVYLVHIM